MSYAPPFDQLLYISTVSPTQQVDLAAILDLSRRNNRLAQITGLLMFNGKRFLQVLEGPPAAISATYARIAADRRHRAPVLLARKQIAEREFGDWSMGYQDPSQPDGANAYRAIAAKVEHASPSLRVELLGFAQQINA